MSKKLRYLQSHLKLSEKFAQSDTFGLRRADMSRSIVGVALLSIFCLIVITSSFAQTAPGTGIPPFGSFNRDSIDTINVANLNIHFEFPVFAKKGRGLDFYAKLVHDNAVIQPVSTPTTTELFQINWFDTTWQLLAPGSDSLQYSNSTGTVCHINGQTVTPVIYSNFVYLDTNNTPHSFGTNWVGYPSTCVGPNQSVTARSTDGLYVVSVTITDQGAFTTKTVTDNNGNIRDFIAATLTDANGNQISTPIGRPWIDTTGNQVLSSIATGWDYPGPSGGLTEAITLTNTTFSLKTNYQCSNIADLNGSQSLPLTTQITLPDSSSYTIVYESTDGTYPSTVTTGRIHSLTLPSGATITYTYSGGTHSINCQDGNPAILTKTTPDGTWTYNHYLTLTQSPNGIWSTIVTDPAGNDTLYTFGTSPVIAGAPSAAGLETERQLYQGSHTSGTSLEYIITCYDGNFANCPSANTLNSFVAVTRKDAYRYPSGSTQPSLFETLIDTYGRMTQDNEFNFGVNTGSAPTATPLKATMTSYATLGSNIMNRPSCVQVTAGSSPATCGTVTSATTSITKYLNYDSSGNVGTIQKWVSGSTYLSQGFTYLSGLVHITTEPNGTQTTYTYNSCNGSYPDTITEAGLSRTSTWDCNGGVLTQVNDVNNQPTKYEYNDPFWRVTKMTDPIGNTTSYVYTPTTEETVLNFLNPACSTCTVDNLTTYDGLGRPYLAQKLKGPGSSNWDTVVTRYDTNGRVASVGMPCVSQQSQPCTSPVTSTTYDALNRPLNVQDGGTGYTSYAYNSGATGSDVLITVGPSPSPENTKRRQLEYDGLGRLTSVCEILTTGGTSCGQNTAASGYKTSYAHSTPAAGGSQTVVTQGAQTRTYVYDGLQRLTSETNPESGTTTYTYDSWSAGLCGQSSQPGQLMLTTRADGSFICYVHDSFGRLTDGGYGPANGYCKHLRYDAGNNGLGTPPGTISNAAGRLVEAETDDCGLPTPHTITDEWYSYSARGENTDVYESTPHSSGYYHTTAAYAANGELLSLGGIPGYGAMSYALDGEGRPSTAQQGTTKIVCDSTCSPQLSTTFDPGGNPLTVKIGGTTDNDTYTYDPNTGRMTGFTFTVGATPKSFAGGLTWNPNGSLRQLAITDGFNAGGTQTCTYGTPSVIGYDDLGRLLNANCGSLWSQSYSYDQYGNITKSGSISWACASCYNNNNQYNSTLSGSISYDPNGNLLNDTFFRYIWDVYGHVATIAPLTGSTTCGSTGVTCLTYDASGNAVEKNVAGVFSEILFSPVGKTAVMSGQTTSTAYLPLPAGETLTETGSTGGNRYFWHKDWLGSVRFASTVVNRASFFDRAFAPFGESYDKFGNASGLDFTGDTQDIVAGLFDTDNRQYHPTQGRWISPDPDGIQAADPSNPQSWNRYAYVLNNPLNRNDPEGLDCIYVDPDSGQLLGWNRGDCDNSTEEKADSGNYVAGTVDWSSMRYDQASESLNFSYTDENGNIGTVSVLGVSPRSLSDQISASWQNFKDSWEQRIQAHRPPPQKPNGLEPLQDINDMMMGWFPQYGVPLVRDVTGKIHSDIPDHIPDSWTKEDLEMARDELRESIKQRNVEQSKYGEEGGHRHQINKEERLLRQVEKKLSGS